MYNCFLQLPPENSQSTDEWQVAEAQSSENKRDPCCFGALGDPDLEDMFVALLASLLKTACPRVQSEQMSRKAVQQNPVLSDGKTAAIIKQLTHFVLFDEESKLKDVAETVEQWNRIADRRHGIFQRRAREQDSGDPRTLLADRDSTLNEDEMSECFDEWCMEFLTYHLTPEQNENPIYQLGDKLTGKQRSFCGSMLRKYAGHKAIGMAIWQKGLPCQLLARGSDNDWVTEPHMIENDLTAMIQFFNSFGTVLNEPKEMAVSLTPWKWLSHCQKISLRQCQKQAAKHNFKTILEDYENKGFPRGEKALKRPRLDAFCQAFAWDRDIRVSVPVPEDLVAPLPPWRSLSHCQKISLPRRQKQARWRTIIRFH